MRKILLIGISILIITSLIILGYFFFHKTSPFFLEDKYYANPRTEELELEDLQKLIEQKESFAVFVYQPLCTTSTGLSEILKEYSKEKGIFYYNIAYAKIKDIDDFAYVKFYPSFIIFKEGKMVDYLDAESDDDTKKFKDKDTFVNWFESYVKIKDKNYTYIEDENNTSEDSQNVDYDFTLDDVKREDNKVNIYLFWGEGCPFCKREKAFFEELKTEYGDKYNLYLYEVFYNEDNKKILRAFAQAMGKELDGVPFTVIGNQTFEGFEDEMKEEIKKAIDSQYINSYDVYFDTIKAD